MKKYFNVYFEFNHKVFEETIEKTSLQGKGYSCFIDATSLTYAYNNPDFKDILNGALVNSCDGSYIALMAGKIHNENLKEYIGPDFFSKFVYKPYKQVIIGSSKEVYSKILEKVAAKGADVSKFHYIELPFVKVDDFGYKAIADEINDFEPRFIWVSLGAPKQEIFMSYLLPYLNKGVMIGVGAAFNYFTGEIKDIPKWARKTHLIWFYRILTEPKKQITRFKQIIKVLPKMYIEEKKRIKSPK